MTPSVICPACASECPDGARFCPNCGAALAVLSSHAVERKVVTTMFCDLVDFTSFCEEVDPEEADRVLREFFALARRSIETYGGVVEKFVGDAVVGVFGVPSAHEDDAERAVITAVRLCDKVAALSPLQDRDLQVRIGVNTGTAVVRLDVVPGSGEGFLVGDAVNTAARLQKLAPPMGVVVGEETHELTVNRMVYEALAPARVKGKRRVVGSWLAKGPISRMGVDLRREYPAPLVDREVELGVLRGLLKKVRASSQPQFAIVVGEAGIGKSRLMFEFLRYIDSRPAIVRWRQGRCPAYGDGLTFWALGEIVREQLGVGEFDEAAAVEAKLAQELSGQEDGEWLATRLRPLLGLESPTASREENFAAWLRFFEHIAADSPAVFVLEDLHWASEATLAFLRYLVENARNVPILAVGTTRPELFQAHPDFAERLWGFGAAHSGVQIDLNPLSASETQELVARVGRGLGDLEETQTAIIHRSAGNPLFVEQLVSHLEAQSPAVVRAADVTLKDRVAQALPESLQSLIAARLDALPPERKVLLADAAVVGDVFWTGAVAALDHGDREAAERGLDDLARRDMVRRERSSSVAGESEFVFRHTLIRDVAYAQLTRADRAAKHAAVARWIEATAGERVDEVAEILAHHCATAFELAEATRDDRLQTDFLRPAVEALELAGDHALPLDVRAAEQHYARAAAFLDRRGVSEPRLQMKWADALWQSGHGQRGLHVLDKAISDMEGSGRPAELALASTRKVLWLWDLDSHQWPQLPQVAADLLYRSDDSPELVRLLHDWAYICFYRDDREEGMAAVTRAIDMAARLGLRLPVLALGLRGVARCEEGDPAGFDDLRTAVHEARCQGAEHAAGRVAGNLADQLVSTEGPVAAARLRRQALERAQHRHDNYSVARLSADLVGDLVWSGKWDEADALAETLEPELAQRSLDSLGDVRSCAALAFLLRGELDAAERRATWAESHSRGTRFETRCAGVMTLALVRAAQGDAGAAIDLLRACPQLPGAGRRLHHYTLRLPQACRVAINLGDQALARQLSADLGTRPLDRCVRLSIDAAIADAQGEPKAADLYARAASGWGRLAVPYEQGWALLRRAVCLGVEARVEEAVTAAAAASAVFGSLGATPALAESDALLARTGRAPSSRRTRQAGPSPGSGRRT